MILSADLRNLPKDQPECFKMLLNTEILAVNQDPAAHAPQVCAYGLLHNATPDRLLMCLGNSFVGGAQSECVCCRASRRPQRNQSLDYRPGVQPALARRLSGGGNAEPARPP